MYHLNLPQMVENPNTVNIFKWNLLFSTNFSSQKWLYFCIFLGGFSCSTTRIDSDMDHLAMLGTFVVGVLLLRTIIGTIIRKHQDLFDICKTLQNTYIYCESRSYKLVQIPGRNTRYTLSMLLPYHIRVAGSWYGDVLDVLFLSLLDHAIYMGLTSKWCSMRVS